jgi:hypothetical protein
MINHSAVLLACRAKLATLSGGVPDVASENIPFTPDPTAAYFEEQYVPGPMRKETISPTGENEVRPLYILHVKVPQNVGTLDAWGYANALLALFKPGTGLTVTDHTVTVRGDPAPFAGQLRIVDSFAVVTVTVPLRVRVVNV